MRRHLKRAVYLTAAFVALAGLPASSQVTHEPLTSDTALERATVYTKTVPGLEYVGNHQYGVVANTPDGPKIFGAYDRIYDLNLSEATSVGTQYVNYCDATSFEMTHPTHGTHELSGAQLNADSILSCSSDGRVAYLVVVVDGTEVARKYSWANGVGSDPVMDDLPIIDPVSVEIKIGGVAFTSADGQDTYSSKGPYEPWESGPARRIERNGNTVTERWPSGSMVVDPYTVPASSTEIIQPNTQARVFVNPSGLGGVPSLQMLQVSGFYKGTIRNLPLPFTPDHVIEQSQRYMLVHGDTMTTISPTSIVSVSNRNYDQVEGGDMEIVLWEESINSTLKISGEGTTHDGIRYDLNIYPTQIPGGIRFRPPVLPAGEYTLKVGTRSLAITLSGEPSRVPLRIQLSGGNGSSSSFHYLSCETPTDPGRTKEVHANGGQTINGSKTLTFQVLKGTDCKVQASNGSWGAVVDGVSYDWRGNATTFKKIDEPLTIGLDFTMRDRPIWIVASRSGGAVAATRTVTLDCYNDGRSVHRRVIELEYDVPKRAAVPFATANGSECVVLADDGPDADLTAGYQWQDEFDEPVAVNRGGVLLTNGVPAWVEIVDLVVHPLDDNAQFVIQQYKDFANRKPNATESYAWWTDLNSGKQQRSALVEGLLGSNEFKSIADPNIRLYQAYFDRLPDSEGLNYWMDVRLGGYPIGLVSDQFSLSQEFTNTYGDASDTEFIRLVYVNVLDREPDDDGYAYWLGLMNSGQITRGELMIYFSESAEYRNTWETQVRVVGAFIAMLDRVPTEAELSYEIGQLKAGKGIRPLINRILASEEYEVRFWDHYRGPRIVDQTAGDSLLTAGAPSTDPALPAKPPTNRTRP